WHMQETKLDESYCVVLSTVSHGPGLNVGENYEVVRPIRLHTVDKRDAEVIWRTQITAWNCFLLYIYNKFHEYLAISSQLLSKDYSETHYLEDGTRVTTTPQQIDNCYYQGKIVGEDASEASISTCDGLRETLGRTTDGEIHSHGRTGYRDPGPMESLKQTGQDRRPSSPCCQSSRQGSSINGVAFQFLRMGKDKDALRKRVFEVVNFVNMAYKPLLTFVALVGLEIWTSTDRISITSNTGQNLDNFMIWRNKELINTKHDCAHLISGVDFDGGTVGLAYVGALCTGYSVGVVQDHTDSGAAVGATLAHELGHNLGMSHDGSTCACSGDNCIMDWSIPRDFSTCSLSKYHEFLTGRSVNCLLDKPLYKTLVASPVCGNGFVEEGELCDCGDVKECKNLCCNAMTCQLSAGSQCAEGECCENCKVCTTVLKDECDLADNCDGVNAVCPKDVFAVNGAPCNGGRGYCYNGGCPQRLEQCRKMFGPGQFSYPPPCPIIHPVPFKSCVICAPSR
uniref:ADAM metallopeptidase domain 28 n=1 Tax=Neogobius melanostomus TaxID=47308 RepID=A0A8C6T1L3_9GOBI